MTHQRPAMRRTVNMLGNALLHTGNNVILERVDKRQ
jgi:hypothetical protein